MTADRPARLSVSSGGASTPPLTVRSLHPLFERIGSFLLEHDLEPTPLHYDFAYRILSQPDGPLARAVAALLEREAQLTADDVESLVRRSDDLDGATAAVPTDAQQAQADGLMARTWMQIEDFEVTVRSMLAETQGLGRDLATATAAALHRGEASLDAMIRGPAAIAAAMLERLYHTEWRLRQARKEAGELRGALGAAHADARSDPLTGLANRRAFAEAFDQASAMARVMAIYDVDHFKGINDRYGHGVGDRVLKAIAAQLEASLEGHLVARYGGEEFAVLLLGVDLEAAHAAVDAARLAIASSNFDAHLGGDPRAGQLTVSAGLVEAAPGEPLEAVYWRADSCLYVAKTQGRNSVVCM